MPVQGLHLITPTAAVATGTGATATIGPNGQVTYSSSTVAMTLELRGIFSSLYDNYQLVFRNSPVLNAQTISAQMVSGTTVDSTSNYIYQSYAVSGTTVSGTRSATSTSANVALSNVDGGAKDGFIAFIYGPYLAQPTVGRSLVVESSGGINPARIAEYAWSHNVSSSFDGIKFSWSNAYGGGAVAVYGMRK